MVWCETIDQIQESIQENVRQFARKEIAPLVSKAEWDGTFPSSIIRRCNELGLFGVLAPSDSGGVEADFATLLLVTEEMSKVSPSLAAQIAFHNIIYLALKGSASGQLARQMAQRMLLGNVGSICFDRSGLRCKITSDGVVVNGICNHVIGAIYGEIFLVHATIDGTKRSSLLIFSKDSLESNQSNFRIGKPHQQVGMRALGMASIEFNDLKLSSESILFDESRTEDALIKLLCDCRLVVAAQALGIADALIEFVTKYATRSESAKNSSSIRELIVNSMTNLETSRALCYSTAAASNSMSPITLQRNSAISRISASACAVNTGIQAIRVCMGIAGAYPIDRYVKDAITVKDMVESEESLKQLIATSALT